MSPADWVRERFQQSGGIRWVDLRAAGRLAILYATCFLVSGAIGLYDWLHGRKAGCASPQTHDPGYVCPTGAHTFTIWLLVGATVVLGIFIGVPAIRTRNKRELPIVAVIQLAILGTLIWIAQDPSFHAHLR